MRSTIRHTGRLAVVATAVCLGFGVLGGTAFAANEEPDLKLTLEEAPAVAPGDTVEVPYVLENVSSETTDSILLNMSLPEFVSFAAPNCQQTGETEDGGTLVSCNISGPEAVIAPGEKLETVAPFQISPDAPEGAELGKLGALVVPLDEGQESGDTEDWTDITGHNADETLISTGAGGGGIMSQFMSLFS